MKSFSPVLKTAMLFLALLVCLRVSPYVPKHPQRHGSEKKTIITDDPKLESSFPGTIERLLDNIERNIVTTAEAMPEDKFNFSPENLELKTPELHGMRTFAGQVKHLATDNFAIWSPLTNEPLRADIKDVNGPENIKTKAEIIHFLKESFALGHRAIATLTAKNATHMIPFRGRNLPRLDLAFYALTHANEHYGQMVVYLRMCGKVPPATIAEGR